MLGPGSATWTPTKENASSLFYLSCGEVGFYFLPSLDLLLKRWKFSSGSDLAIPPACHDPSPFLQQPVSTWHERNVIQVSMYPWLWMLQHIGCALVLESGTAA